MLPAGGSSSFDVVGTVARECADVWPTWLGQTSPVGICAALGKSCWEAAGVEAIAAMTHSAALIAVCVFMNIPPKEFGNGARSRAWLVVVVQIVWSSALSPPDERPDPLVNVIERGLGQDLGERYTAGEA
jgi:hypothetical protein